MICLHLRLISIDSITRAEFGMVINDVVFKSHPFTVIYRNELKPFEYNSWFICLNTDELNASVQGYSYFSKLYEYARKMKDAIEIEDNVDVLFKKCNLTVEEFNILKNEIFEHEIKYKGSKTNPNPYDYDASDV